MLLCLSGDIESGKSSLLYSAPLPIVCCAFDAGANRALYGDRHFIQNGVDIKVMKYPFEADDLDMHRLSWGRNNKKSITVYLFPQELKVSTMLVGNRVLWNKMSAILGLALSTDWVKTVGVDTMTVARRVASDVHLERVQNSKDGNGRVQLIQVEFGKVHDLVRAIYTQAQNTVEAYASEGMQKHFIGTHHLTERRENYTNSQGVQESKIVTKAGQPVLDLEGLPNTFRHVDVALRHEVVWIPDAAKGQNGRTAVIEATYEKCGFSLMKSGDKLRNPTWNTLVDDLNPHIWEGMKLDRRE